MFGRNNFYLLFFNLRALSSKKEKKGEFVGDITSAPWVQFPQARHTLYKSS